MDWVITLDRIMEDTSCVANNKKGMFSQLFACGCQPGDSPDLLTEKFRVSAREGKGAVVVCGFGWGCWGRGPRAG